MHMSTLAITLAGALSLAAPLAYSALSCYAGYKLYRLLTALFGLLAGAGLGVWLGGALGESLGWPGWVGLLAGAVALGVLGGFLAFRFYEFCVCLQTGVVTALVLAFVLLLATQSWQVGLAGGAVLGLVAGVLTGFFLRQILIVTTAFNGGVALATSLSGLLLGGGDWMPASLESAAGWLEQTGVLLAVLSVVFVATGVLVQLRTTRRAG